MRLRTLTYTCGRRLSLIYIVMHHTLGVAKHHLDMGLRNACQCKNISFGFDAANDYKFK